MRKLTASSLCLMVLTGFGCQSVSSPTTPNVTPDDFGACTDHHRRCRDRCAPAEVRKVACYGGNMGGVTKICECEEGTVL
ncbi:MAG: hypothetical protein QNL88_02370, partial [Acidobacteriota bacterium]|nr:hypothetical protein [Acidobacteriota bacterium]